MDTLSFLNAVWGALPPDSLVGVTVDVERDGKPVTKTFWASVPAARASIAEKALAINRAKQFSLPERGGCYWNCASRRLSVLKKPFSRGGVPDVEAVGAFWCDVDLAKAPLVSKERALLDLLQILLPPSLVVDSGGGLHAIHLLSEPFFVSGDAARAHLYRQQAQAVYRCVKDERGLPVDPAVFDAARMLRLPGSVNRKASRNGAECKVVYFSERRYSLAEIAEAFPLAEAFPEGDQAAIELPKGGDDGRLFFLPRESAELLLCQFPPGDSRHVALVRLASQLAASGAPKDAVCRPLWKLAAAWPGDHDFSEEEFRRVLDWAYAQGQLRPSLFATVALSVDGDRFVRAEAPSMLPGAVTLKRPEGVLEAAVVSLEEARERLRGDLSAYLDGAADGASLLHLAMPPGVGKTHMVWEALYKRKGVRAVFFTPFRDEAWQARLAEFGVDPAEVYNWRPRTDQKDDAGYCMYAKEVNAVAAKGYKPAAVFCANCPIHKECREKHYLSQAEKVKKHRLVLVRHQNIHQEELFFGRNCAVIDEAPFGALEDYMEIAEEDIPGKKPACAGTADDTPLVDQLVDDLRRMVREARSGVKADGKALYERYPALKALGELSEEGFERSVYTPLWSAGSRERVEDWKANFLPRLHDICQDEVARLKQGKLVHSRIQMVSKQVRLYSTGRINLPNSLKVVVCDASTPTSVYLNALRDARGNQRALFPSSRAELEFKGRVYQVTDGVNGRTLFRRRGKAGLEELKELVRKVKGAYARPLIVTFKQEAERLREAGFEDVHWYHSLRGSNQFQNCDAVVLIGTPYISGDDIVATAKVRHYDTDKPIRAAVRKKLKPYPGTNKAYVSFEYVDSRVQQVHDEVLGEMWQMVGRARPFTRQTVCDIILYTPYNFLPPTLSPELMSGAALKDWLDRKAAAPAQLMARFMQQFGGGKRPVAGLYPEFLKFSGKRISQSTFYRWWHKWQSSSM